MSNDKIPSAADLYQLLNTTWKFYDEELDSRVTRCEKKPQEGLVIERCQTSYTAVVKGHILKRDAYPDAYFYEKPVLLNGKPHVVQLLWRRVEGKGIFLDTFYRVYHDLKIFNGEGALIALMDDTGQITSGASDLVQQAIKAMCPNTWDRQLGNFIGVTCEDFPRSGEITSHL